MLRSLHLPLLILVLLAGLVAGGCAASMSHSAGEHAMGGEMAGGMTEETVLPTPQPGLVTAEMVRARPAPLVGGNGAVFMVLLNGTDAPVQLQSASSDVAEVVELHETIAEDGVMRMVPQPDGFGVPAGSVVELRPGGKHVMLMGLAAPLELGQAFSLTLEFDTGTALELSVPVVDMMGAMPGMEGMDHGN